jgi:hypothetical protein
VNQELQNWNLRFEDQLVNIPGRILEQEKIYMFQRGNDTAVSVQTLNINAQAKVMHKIFFAQHTLTDPEYNLQHAHSIINRALFHSVQDSPSAFGS